MLIAILVKTWNISSIFRFQNSIFAITGLACLYGSDVDLPERGPAPAAVHGADPPARHRHPSALHRHRSLCVHTHQNTRLHAFYVIFIRFSLQCFRIWKYIEFIIINMGVIMNYSCFECTFISVRLLYDPIIILLFNWSYPKITIHK